MHSLKDTQFWLCYFLFIVPLVKNDLKLCVNHQFIAPSLYNQITQLIFITDIFRPKIKYNVQRFLATRLVCARSVVFCQNFWQITQRLPGNWRGGGKRFSGAFRAGATSPLACLLLARPFFLVPSTSKRLLRRLGQRRQHQRQYPTLQLLINRWNGAWKKNRLKISLSLILNPKLHI